MVEQILGRAVGDHELSQDVDETTNREKSRAENVTSEKSAIENP